MIDQQKGSLWRDNNDHIFRVDKITEEYDGWRTLEGMIIHCPKWCNMHNDTPYTTYAEPDDDLVGGEIFGLSRMWP